MRFSIAGSFPAPPYPPTRPLGLPDASVTLRGAVPSPKLWSTLALSVRKPQAGRSPLACLPGWAC
eukprot:8431218-Alexandrium_andersonii.AAC.1